MPCLSPDRKPGSGFRDSGSGHSLGLRGAPSLAWREEDSSLRLPHTPWMKAELACLLIHFTLEKSIDCNSESFTKQLMSSSVIRGKYLEMLTPA